MRIIRDCPVAVVGGAGFIGSHMVNHLIEDRNCQVLVIDNLCVGQREFIHPKARFEHADITLSEGHLRNLFRMYDVRFVFNYAAWPYLPDSFARPIQVFNVNAVGAMFVINAAQEAGCEGVLQISSAEIYGSGKTSNIEEAERRDMKSDEWSKVEPHSTYGAAKSAIDAMVQVRWREAKTPCIALRQFNCLGERDFFHPYVVPEIVSQLTKQKDSFWRQYKKKGMTLRRMVGTVRLGNNSFRDFLYAGDQVRMAVELLEKGQFGEVYNLGSETGIKIYDLARLIGKLMDFDEIVVEEDPVRKRPWEIWHLQSDNTKIYSVIESRPEVSLEEALKRTVLDLMAAIRGGFLKW